ncbi:MAG: hypothetical protein M4D80_12665 [Myxococcota bacterium]|nr:hypothetical protein [Myxococcota bacterium]
MLRCLVLAILLAASSTPAHARAEKTLAYQRDVAWPAAVRFIRVDEGLKIIEKDAEAGYVLFEIKEEGKTFRGSLEVMTVVIEGRTLVKFVMQIDERPSWVEIAMLTRLERKLRSELGTPAPPPAKKPKPDQDDKDKPKDEPAPPKKDEPKKPDEGGPPISPTP